MKKISTFSERLSESISDMSVTEAAKFFGISKQSISAYLNNLRCPKHLTIIAMAQALDVNPAWLMGYDEPKRLPVRNSSSNSLDFHLSDHEKELVIAYRNNVALQPAVDRILCIESSPTVASDVETDIKKHGTKSKKGVSNIN